MSRRCTRGPSSRRPRACPAGCGRRASSAMRRPGRCIAPGTCPCAHDASLRVSTTMNPGSSAASAAATSDTSDSNASRPRKCAIASSAVATCAKSEEPVCVVVASVMPDSLPAGSRHARPLRSRRRGARSGQSADAPVPADGSASQADAKNSLTAAPSAARSSTCASSRAECIDSSGDPHVDGADAEARRRERADRRPAGDRVVRDERLGRHPGASAHAGPEGAARGIARVSLVGVELQQRAAAEHRAVGRVVPLGVVRVHGVARVGRDAPRRREGPPPLDLAGAERRRRCARARLRATGRSRPSGTPSRAPRGRTRRAR